MRADAGASTHLVTLSWSGCMSCTWMSVILFHLPQARPGCRGAALVLKSNENACSVTVFMQKSLKTLVVSLCSTCLRRGLAAEALPWLLKPLKTLSKTSFSTKEL